MREIYIIRHGETEYNKKKIIQGRGVDAPLNETGKQQALKFYNQYKERQFDAVFSSNLIRTKQTLQPFSDKGYDILSFSEIDEIDWGSHEGKISTSDLRGEYKKIITSWRNGDYKVTLPNGESPYDVQERLKYFINNTLETSKGRILICSHGRTMRIFLCTLLGYPLSRMDDFTHENLSLYKLKGNNLNYELLLKNCTKHLN